MFLSDYRYYVFYFQKRFIIFKLFFIFYFKGNVDNCKGILCSPRIYCVHVYLSSETAFVASRTKLPVVCNNLDVGDIA